MTPEEIEKKLCGFSYEVGKREAYAECAEIAKNEKRREYKWGEGKIAVGREDESDRYMHGAVIAGAIADAIEKRAKELS